MHIQQARLVVSAIPDDKRGVMADAHARYMHFTGVIAGELPVDQVAEDRATFAHLLKFASDGRPALSDERCAEFMASITGLPRDWCLAWDEVEFCDTHGDDFAERQLRVQSNNAFEAECAAEHGVSSKREST